MWLGEECLQEQEAGADHQAAVGDIEDRPINEVMPVEEIADAVKDNPVIEIAQGAGQDQTQKQGQEPIVTGMRPPGPGNDSEGGANAHHGENDVAVHAEDRVPPAEQRSLVYMR